MWFFTKKKNIKNENDSEILAYITNSITDYSPEHSQPTVKSFDNVEVGILLEGDKFGCGNYFYTAHIIFKWNSGGLSIRSLNLHGSIQLSNENGSACVTLIYSDIMDNDLISVLKKDVPQILPNVNTSNNAFHISSVKTYN
jgi:hypothetical protein